ncbi:AraC family transcriptional regulator [Streptomyces sp. ms191]|uniref:helix-turn-helix domain-containing protein n=1 Tax=unclassified Streptomyces TaxID=2593676 RepID=UPI0011CE63B3|nr:helix-turn-helix domain-containing protein [Streptomyces sp. ms191]TXS30878.1 AraC family transcriptional regulator [Streptomyces sp. ms191]
MSPDGPRRDTRGIVDAAELLTHVRFRRREPAPELRPYLEHYWLIDWDLAEPYASHVVPHPSVNVVFQRYESADGGGDAESFGEVAGIGLELFTKKLTGRGRVCGVQFRPGGFRPFAPAWPVSRWTGRRVPLDEVFADAGRAAGRTVAAVLDPATDDARAAALDAFLLAHGPAPDAQAEQAMALVDLVRRDRTVRRVSELAAAGGLSARSLQRLFATRVGVGPKWVILRYRIHEALEHAESGEGPDTLDWARLAADLGYSDQAHLVRDFTATVGVPPTAYARQVSDA